MPIIRPVSDIATGGWTSTDATLFGAIDEVTPDDADFISSTTAGQIAQVKLDTASDPGGDDNHVLRYRAASDGARGVIARVIQPGGAPGIVTSKQPWRRQPQNNISSLVHCVMLPSIRGRTVDGRTITFSATPNTAINSNGMAYRHANNYVGLASIPESLVGTTDAGGSLLAVWRTTSTATDARFVAFGTDQGSSGNSIFSIGHNLGSLRVTVGGSGNNIAIEYPVNANNGAIHAAVLSAYRVVSGWGLYSVACDGRLLAGGVSTGIELGSLTAYKYLVAGGSRRGGTNTPAFDGDVLLAASFIHRALSPSECVSLSTNPWQIFKPITQRTFVDFGGRKVIAQRTPTLTSTPTDYSIDLTPTEAAEITDYANLAIEVEST